MSSEPLANAPVQADRRLAPRKKFHGKVEIEWGSATLTATIRDIGPQGIFIELTPPLWMGARFLAQIIVQPRITLDCTVRRVEPGKGIGVTFEVSDGSGKAQLDALLAELPAA